MPNFPVPSDRFRVVRTVVLCSALLGASGIALSAEGAEGGQGGGHSGGHSGGRGGHAGGGHDDGAHEDTDHGGGHSGGHGGSGHGGSGRASVPGGRATENLVLRGRRPVWAGGDFPEVELGRLNVSRAPGRVLDHARLLAAEEVPADAASLYGLTAEEAAARFASAFDETERFHSPVQNLALYRELMTFGSVELFPFEPASRLDLAAILLASAAERTKPITVDTVRALNIILGLVDLPAEDASTLAAKAELVRSGLDIGHGPEGDHTDEGDDHGSDAEHGGPGGSRGSGDEHGSANVGSEETARSA